MRKSSSFARLQPSRSCCRVQRALRMRSQAPPMQPCSGQLVPSFLNRRSRALLTRSTHRMPFFRTAIPFWIGQFVAPGAAVSSHVPHIHVPESWHFIDRTTVFVAAVVAARDAFKRAHSKQALLTIICAVCSRIRLQGGVSGVYVRDR
jgi:hypothetical protein